MKANEQALAALLAEATQKPWQYSFYGLTRVVDAQNPQLPLMGKSLSPKQERLSYGQSPSLFFSPREIAQIQAQGDKHKIELFGLGLLGPNGPLPLHFTEIIKDGIDNRKDATLANFLDMFHHRYIALLYRGWAQSRPTVSLDRPNEDVFSANVLRLLGLKDSEEQGSALPLHARLSMAPHAVHEAKTPEHLEATLNHFFSVPIKLSPFQLHWLKLAEEDTTRLGAMRQSSYLEQGAVLGAEVPDCQSKFRLSIGPMKLSNYMRFTPSGQDFKVLVDIVRSFVGYELAWDIRLLANAEEAHMAQLGANDRLGWNTWLGENPDEKMAVGMTFDPELYMTNQTC